MKRIYLLLAVFLAACGGEGESVAGDDGGTDSSANESASIVGSWVGQCGNNDALGAQAVVTEVYGSNGVAVFKYQNFLDAGCTEPGYYLEVRSAYAVGGDRTLADGTVVKELEFTDHVQYMTLPDDSYADSYNANSFCGIDYWQAGVKVLTGSCGPSVGVTAGKSIFYIDGNALHTGRLSQEYPASIDRYLTSD